LKTGLYRNRKVRLGDLVETRRNKKGTNKKGDKTKLGGLSPPGGT